MDTFRQTIRKSVSADFTVSSPLHPSSSAKQTAESELLIPSQREVDRFVVQRIVASCSGACLTSLLMNPLDVAKIRLQAQDLMALNTRPGSSLCSRPLYLRGTWDALKKIAKHEGVKSLYHGLTPTLMLSIPGKMLYFTLYDELRAVFTSFSAQTSASAASKEPWWVPVLAGATARGLAVVSISPLELVRTQAQASTRAHSIQSIWQTVINDAGVAGLWRGLQPSLLRDVPFSALYWFGYERFRGAILSWWQCGEDTPPEISTMSLCLTAFVSGSCSGTCAAVLTHPFDVLKTQQQIGSSRLASTGRPRFFELLQRTIAERGFRALFVGLAPRLAKVAPACAVMISSFELGKLLLGV